jgi:hypothetical protein
MFHLLLAAVVLAQSAPTLKVAPAQVATIDLSKMKGSLLCQLAWSPDGTELYLQTCDEDKAALLKDSFHYTLPVAGGAPKQVDVRPAWAADYWAWKSAQTAPRDPNFKIELRTSQEVLSATAHPMAGDLATGGSNPGRSGVPVQTAANAARDSQTANVYRMMLNGQVIGEWINHRTMPGVTFGWGPLESGLIAYTERESGALILMDKSGGRQKIDGTKDVLLPAFTADGQRLAYLADLGHHKFALVVAAIVR